MDNASTDGSVTAAEERFPKVRGIQNAQNLGFAAANNQALKQIKGRYALLVNTDVVITRRGAELFHFMEQNCGSGEPRRPVAESRWDQTELDCQFTIAGVAAH